MSIPKGCTHVWTPAITRPYVSFFFRRAYYKQVKDTWYYYSRFKDWVVSGNDPQWFIDEKKCGYFVTRKTFTNPKFVPVKEVL